MVLRSACDQGDSVESMRDDIMMRYSRLQSLGLSCDLHGRGYANEGSALGICSRKIGVFAYIFSLEPLCPHQALNPEPQALEPCACLGGLFVLRSKRSAANKKNGLNLKLHAVTALLRGGSCLGDKVRHSISPVQKPKTQNTKPKTLNPKPLDPFPCPGAPAGVTRKAQCRPPSLQSS